MVRYRNLGNRIDNEQEIEVSSRVASHIETFFETSSKGKTRRSQPIGYQHQEALPSNRLLLGAGPLSNRTTKNPLPSSTFSPCRTAKLPILLRFFPPFFLKKRRDINSLSLCSMGLVMTPLEELT
jgi:hypothetical protein